MSNCNSVLNSEKRKERSTEEVIFNEINLMKIAKHPNIIRFYGVTKFKDEKNYSLVLEYADSGTLKKYLENNATTFGWKSQLRIAKEISSAILCLHDNKIVHRDLHPGNILIHQNSIKLADFGNAYLLGSDYLQKSAYGVFPYVDPKFLESDSYILTEKYDIYSLGKIFQELVASFSVSNTNSKFVKLHQKCCQHEPDNRPDIFQVVSELNEIDSENKSEIIEKDDVDSFSDSFPDDDLQNLHL